MFAVRDLPMTDLVSKENLSIGESCFKTKFVRTETGDHLEQDAACMCHILLRAGRGYVVHPAPKQELVKTFNFHHVSPGVFHKICQLINLVSKRKKRWAAQTKEGRARRPAVCKAHIPFPSPPATRLISISNHPDERMTC